MQYYITNLDLWQRWEPITAISLRSAKRQARIYAGREGGDIAVGVDYGDGQIIRAAIVEEMYSDQWHDLI